MSHAISPLLQNRQRFVDIRFWFLDVHLIKDIEIIGERIAASVSGPIIGDQWYVTRFRNTRSIAVHTVFELSASESSSKAQERQCE